MRKKFTSIKLQGYLTVEASMVMILMIALYSCLIYLAFFLYAQCVLSQDAYLLSFRASVFTGTGYEYGEVIYSRENQKNLQENDQYVMERNQLLMGKCPAYQQEKQEVQLKQNKAEILQSGKVEVSFLSAHTGAIVIEKSATSCNPIQIIRQNK